MLARMNVGYICFMIAGGTALGVLLSILFPTLVGQTSLYYVWLVLSAIFLTVITYDYRREEDSPFVVYLLTLLSVTQLIVSFQLLPHALNWAYGTVEKLIS